MGTAEKKKVVLKAKFEELAKDKKGLIDYNCRVFQDAITKVFAREWEKDDKEDQKDETEAATVGESSGAKGKISAQNQLENQLEGMALRD